MLMFKNVTTSKSKHNLARTIKDFSELLVRDADEFILFYLSDVERLFVICILHIF